VSLEIKSPSEIKFLKWTDESWRPTPLPLWRTFSLMRLAGCNTIVIDKKIWSKNCHENRCENEQSCKDYIENLKYYDNAKFIQKECYKLHFFNSKFSKEEQIYSQEDDNLLGFCTVHNDTMEFEGRGKYKRPYVPEISIKAPFAEKRGFVFGLRTAETTVNGKTFKARGNYFSQQNALTNCCSQASIKMALRGNHSQITAEKINKVVGIDHLKRKGNEGLELREIHKAITELSKQKTYLLQAGDFKSPIHFLKIIYHALECRFPVIFVFRLSGEKNDPSRSRGHAVTLIGHTFNEHNWWSYAMKNYFTPKDEALGYLSSFLWCDNFIVQDDRVGPYHLLPTRFLMTSSTSNKVLSFIRQAMIETTRSFSLKDLWIHEPLNAIIILPEPMKFFRDVQSIEPLAMEQLNETISILDQKNRLPEDKTFNEFFYKYYRNKSLILRTFIIPKNEYLRSLRDGNTLNDYEDSLKDWLPELFWIIEIGVPELFWINQKKVGEIVIHPKEIEKTFIRLPNIIIFSEKNKLHSYDVKESNTLLPLIEPTNSFAT
jgi:hypothetical protein